MSNPWGVKLKSTGRIDAERVKNEMELKQLEERQSELEKFSEENAEKMREYKQRQESLAADAMLGQQ